MYGAHIYYSYGTWHTNTSRQDLFSSYIWCWKINFTIDSLNTYVSKIKQCQPYYIHYFFFFQKCIFYSVTVKVLIMFIYNDFLFDPEYNQIRIIPIKNVKNASWFPQIMASENSALLSQE